MSTTPDSQQDAAPVTARRKRVRRLKAAVATYKRLFAISTFLVVVLSLALVAFILTDEPEAIPIGAGRAGLMEPASTVDTNDERVEGGKRILPEGDASYYGDELAGRPTASGESFNPEGMTAAHRTLPMGTRLRVTNTRNGQSVVVRVNDRGPFSGRRVLDLSYAAARQIGMVKRGEARVRMEVLQ